MFSDSPQLGPSSLTLCDHSCRLLDSSALPVLRVVFFECVLVPKLEVWGSRGRTACVAYQLFPCTLFAMFLPFPPPPFLEEG